MKASWRGYALALVAALCWSCGGLMAKWLSLDPAAMTGARCLVAAALLGVILLATNRQSFVLKQPRRDLLFLLVFGIFGQAGMSYTYLMAIAHNPVGVAILLEYLAPVFSLLLGLVIFRHKPQLMSILGVGLAILGVALVVGVIGTGGLGMTSIGLAWGIASAVFFSLYSVMGGRVKDRFSAVTLLFYGMTVSALFWSIVIGPTRVLAPLFSTSTMLPILALGSLSTLLPFGAFLFALRYIAPVNAGITAMAEPVLASIGGMLLFGEALTGSFVAGGLLILVAVALVQMGDRSSAKVGTLTGLEFESLED